MAAGPEHLVQKVEQGADLSREESFALFTEIMSGMVADERVESLLRALAAKGETVDELVGAAELLRRHVTPIRCDSPAAIDTCGTGGDGISTFNVSTAAAIVAAGAGAVVAKHGNRSNSRKSGSVEALAALGVKVDAPPAVVERCLREAGIAFLFAPMLHPVMARVAEIRRRIGRPTIFNLVGPLANPAGVRRQIIGVPREELVPKMAGALARLGAVRAFVVHGRDGLCDLTITGESSCAEVAGGGVRATVVTPEAVGLTRASLDALRVEGPERSAEVIRGILAGESGSPRDHALLNAGIALVAADIAVDLRDGVERAAHAIDGGAARDVLDRLVRISGEET